MNPFASIWEDTPKAIEKPKPVAKPKLKPDHSVARKIYCDYLIKSVELTRHRIYADKVARATDGPSKTPVMPLACMGTNNGPLLCDHCGKAILLEDGPYYNVPADVAWAANQKRHDKWVSYIKGGLLVRIVDNGTLRIYHGYDGTPGHCCTIAKAQMDAAEALHVRDHSKFNLIYKFLKDEYPDKTDAEQQKLASDVIDVMFSFDPGIGVNVP